MKEASKKARQFYEIFCKGKIDITDSKTAEMIKLSENTYRDVNIAYANELSMLCFELGINEKEVIKLTLRPLILTEILEGTLLFLLQKLMSDVSFLIKLSLFFLIYSSELVFIIFGSSLI